MRKTRRVSIRQSPRLVKKARDTEYLNSYAGKWVLVVDEQVVASGATLKEVAKRRKVKKDPGNSSETFVFLVPTPEEMMAVVTLL